jgi:DNA-binding CsgD family transcriptional regulator
MPRISHRDTHSLSAVIADLYVASDLDTFASRAVQGVRRLVPGERASYHLARRKPNRVTTIVGDGKPAHPAADAIVAQFLPEHYLARHSVRRGPRRWTGTADVMTRDAFRRSRLYEHYYRHMGIEFQIGVVFPSPCGGFFGLVLNRAKGNFSARDRTLLDLLLPHLVQAQSTAARLTELQHDVSSLEQGAELAGVGVVLLDRERRIRVMSKRARRWLDAYFGPLRGSSNCLPQALDDWVINEMRAAERIAPGCQPFVIARQGARLDVRLATSPDGVTLIFAETATEIVPGALETLGLSRREAEVLKWIAEGKRNTEIALILGISPATVRHHVEHVHRKLGVETRMAAAGRAREVAHSANDTV